MVGVFSSGVTWMLCRAACSTTGQLVRFAACELVHVRSHSLVCGHARVCGITAKQTPNAQAFGGSHGWLVLFTPPAATTAVPIAPKAAAYQVASSNITACCFIPDCGQVPAVSASAQQYKAGKQLVYACEDGMLHLYDTQHCLQLRCFSLHHTAVRSISISADGSLMAAGSKSGVVSVWDLRAGLLLQAFR
jgi:hypothetical protein